MGEYNKPWLSFEAQADMLIDERGLIADRGDLITHLTNVGYYRLSGYWYIFKRKPQDDEKGRKDERFIEGTTFDHIWKLYTFDRQFRLIVLDAIERVEIYFRTQLAYELAGKTGPFGFLDPALLANGGGGNSLAQVFRLAAILRLGRRGDSGERRHSSPASWKWGSGAKLRITRRLR
jgi:abortive infection bacteriophage resistance protein